MLYDRTCNRLDYRLSWWSLQRQKAAVCFDGFVSLLAVSNNVLEASIRKPVSLRSSWYGWVVNVHSRRGGTLSQRRWCFDWVSHEQREHLRSSRRKLDVVGKTCIWSSLLPRPFSKSLFTLSGSIVSFTETIQALQRQYAFSVSPHVSGPLDIFLYSFSGRCWRVWPKCLVDLLPAWLPNSTSVRWGYKCCQH